MSLFDESSLCIGRDRELELTAIRQTYGQTAHCTIALDYIDLFENDTETLLRASVDISILLTLTRV